MWHPNTKTIIEGINGYFDEEDEPGQPKTQSLQDIYNSISEVHVVYLLAGVEDVKFEEVVLDERWKKTMDEDIISIEKNET